LDAGGGVPNPFAPLDNTAEVETPEHVRFRYRIAGPSRRAVAYLLDLLIRGAALVVLALALLLASGGSAERPSASNGFILVIAFLLEWGYYVVFETLWSGRTPGKRALRLRTIKEGGYPLGFLDSVLRNLLRAADFLPLGYGLGLLSMAGDARFRRLGDRVAGTMVVQEEAAQVPRPLILSPPATREELELIPARPSLSAWERESLELFLRRAELGPDRKAELAAMIAGSLARRLGVTLRDPVRFLALVHHRLAGARRVVVPR
jgi:uncharacterized RDD family membrane protein YckC